MLVTLISWTLMLFIFTSVGLGVNSLINKSHIKNNGTMCDIIWYGIVCSIVYAQFFSLFYKVGMLAFGILFVISLILIFLFKNRCVEGCKEVRKIYLNHQWNLFVLPIAFVIIIILGLLFTIQIPEHYDTYLYHAQSIRWIEEYGIVKGLGNLHNRFAYNSAFMCLQALFSFSWCISQSLHTINGFLWVLMGIYAIGTLKVYKEKRIYISDVLKILLLIYLCNDIVTANLSSPHTDMMTLLMVLYMIIRWNELLEEGYQGYVSYGILCLLGVCAVSVKLSAIMVLVLTLKPAIILLREKKWNIIWVFLGLGILIIIPFLLRNIILSGYLVYPYASIDIFDVDWKMEKALVVHDNHEIIAWGRMLNDVSRYNETITTWLPIWMRECGSFYSVLMVCNIVLLPVSITIIVYWLYKKNYDKSLMLGCVEILFLGWLLTSPLPRYGLVYLFLGPVFYLAILLEKISLNNKNGKKWIYIWLFRGNGGLKTATTPVFISIKRHSTFG